MVFVVGGEVNRIRKLDAPGKLDISENSPARSRLISTLVASADGEPFCKRFMAQKFSFYEDLTERQNLKPGFLANMQPVAG